MARAFKRVATGSSGVKPWTNEYRQIALNDPMKHFLGIFTRRGLDATPVAGSSLRPISFQLGRKGFYTLLGLPEGYEAAMSLMILGGQMSTDTGKPLGQRQHRHAKVPHSTKWQLLASVRRRRWSFG